MGNELSQAKKLYTLGGGADEGELFDTGNRLPGS